MPATVTAHTRRPMTATKEPEPTPPLVSEALARPVPKPVKLGSTALRDGAWGGWVLLLDCWYIEMGLPPP